MKNMEFIRKASASDSKCNLNAATNNSEEQCDRQIPPVSSSFQASDIVVNHKRPNSFPSSSKREFLTQSGRTKSLSGLISQFETPISDSKNIDNAKINIWAHRDKVRPILLPLPGMVSNVHISTDLQSAAISETKFRSCPSAASRRVNGNTPKVPINKNANLLSVQNSANVPSDERARIEIKPHVSLRDKNMRDVEHLYEEIDESDSECTIKTPECNDSNISTSVNKEMKQKFDRTLSSDDEEFLSPVKQRCQSDQERFGSLDNDKSKVESEECKIGNDEDEVWKNYTDRPLLPLKPLQKQRSMSCVNLVQTIKGLSKKKTGSDSRHSSPINNLKNLLFPENVLIQKKEMYTSEANISEIKTELAASTDLTVRRMNDMDFASKNIRQSLLPNYTWFHPVDAKEASKRLLKMQQNGAFLIRPASNPTSEVLHTLCVVFSRRVYNFHVTRLKDGQITLGKRKGEQETFSTLLEMIKYHQIVPISINSSEFNQVSHVYLLITPPK